MKTTTPCPRSLPIFVKSILTTMYLSDKNKLIPRGHFDPVTMLGHREDLCLKGRFEWQSCAKISALLPNRRHLYAMLSLTRHGLSNGRCRAGFLTAVGMRSIAICRPKHSCRFASRIVSCSRGVRC